jgi:acyl carrier protein
MPRAPDADLVELLRVIRGAIDTFLGQAEPRSPGLPPREDRSGPPAPWRETQPTIPARPAGAIALGRESPAVPQVPPPVVHVAQAPDLADVREEIRRALLEEYVRRTGYPEEMLDPELDLEADLGIDTVKQVAVLAAVRERVGLAPDPGFKLRDASTIAKAVAWFAGRLARTASPATRPPPVRTATRVESAAPAAPAIDAARERVRRALVEELVRRTGYPEEMLDPELDLEAELGIDTVKQVAVLAAVRERFGLTPDPSLKLRNANTIDKAVELLAQRLTAEPPGPRDPPGGPRPPPGGGSPRPLAPPPSVDAGPPAPARAAGPAAHASRRMLEAVLGAAPGDVIEEITGLTLHVSGDEPQAREPLVDVTEEADGAYRLRAVLGVDVTEAIVRTGAAASAPPAPPEIVRAIAPERRGRAASGDELRELLAPVLGQAEGLLQWARSDGFMVAVGGAVSPDGDDVHRLAAVLASAGEVASFAWVGLTGAPHAVCAIERARIHAVPAAGADVSVHAKMVAPEGGLWRADVTVVSGDRLMAEIRGLTGRPFARSAASGPAGAAAERAWQRFCRRMQGERAHEGVA